MNNDDDLTYAAPHAYDLHPITHNCEDCLDYAGHENMHQDEGHEGDSMPTPHCRVCMRDIPKPLKGTKTVRVSGARIDHRPCYAAGTHEKSFEGRESCRRAGGPKL